MEQQHRERSRRRRSSRSPRARRRSCRRPTVPRRQPTTGLSLTWNGGLWGQIYDIYFGTTPNPPLAHREPAAGTQPNRRRTIRSTRLPSAAAGHKLLLEDRVEDDGVHNRRPVRSGALPRPVRRGGGGGTLPAPWTDADVGDVGVAGGASYAAPTFTVNGAGADVWGTADALNYVYQPLSGDGSIVARVATVQNVAAWTKAGVMIRGSLSAGSAQAFMLVSSGNGLAFQRRLTDGGASTSTPGSLSVAPRWVKLTRTGNTIAAFESADGTTTGRRLQATRSRCPRRCWSASGCRATSGA